MAMARPARLKICTDRPAHTPHEWPAGDRRLAMPSDHSEPLKRLSAADDFLFSGKKDWPSQSAIASNLLSAVGRATMAKHVPRAAPRRVGHASGGG